MPLGAAGCKCVAGHLIAVFECAFGLVMQRRANIFDRVDEIEPLCEEPQVGFPRRWRRRESGEIEQRSRVRRSDRSCRAEPAPRASLQVRRIG